jgi:hypothetical protein
MILYNINNDYVKPKEITMRRVIIESPYWNVDNEILSRNIGYARMAVRDCLERGESPTASHLLLTQPGITIETRPIERAYGIEAGLVTGDGAELTVVYTDLGMSSGMITGIERAKKMNRPIEYRKITNWEANIHKFIGPFG